MLIGLLNKVINFVTPLVSPWNPRSYKWGDKEMFSGF